MKFPHRNGEKLPRVERNRIDITRDIFTDKSTIGELSINGHFFCHTLEDTCRKKKIPKITAIPSGRYRLIMHTSPKFGRVPKLMGVLGYTDILIHAGNKPEDTEGCILVGRFEQSMSDWIYSSKDTLAKLIPKIEALIQEDPVLYITILGGPGHES